MRGMSDILETDFWKLLQEFELQVYRYIQPLLKL